MDFKIYNYGELYTVQRTKADAQGRASILTGLGDMVVWAAHEGRYGFAQFTAGKAPQLNLKLTHRAGDTFTTTLNLVPPRGHNNLPDVSPAMAERNRRRMAHEDSIRTAYVHTFADSTRTAELCSRLKLDFARVRL